MEDCLRHPLVLPFAMVLAIAGATGSARAQEPAHPNDSSRVLGRPIAEPTAGVPSGTYLSRVLSRLRRGERLRVDVPIEVEAPSSRTAAVYAARYRISPGLAQTIIDAAIAERVDPELAFRLIRVESVFRVRARGPAGALGLTQLMPSTARSIDRSVRTEAQIMEPSTNLRLGFRYLRGMIEKYDGDVRLGLLAYNRGETAVNRALRAGRDPENGYSRKVLGGISGGGEPYRGLGLLSRAN
jgi:soluble lytic murein transglycosylase-like protein